MPRLHARISSASAPHSERVSLSGESCVSCCWSFHSHTASDPDKRDALSSLFEGWQRRLSLMPHVCLQLRQQDVNIQFSTHTHTIPPLTLLSAEATLFLHMCLSAISEFGGDGESCQGVCMFSWQNRDGGCRRSEDQERRPGVGGSGKKGRVKELSSSFFMMKQKQDED